MVSTELIHREYKMSVGTLFEVASQRNTFYSEKWFRKK
jgi:hypothetical protein